MKKILFVLAIMAGIAGGCDYDYPISLTDVLEANMESTGCINDDASCGYDGKAYKCINKEWVEMDSCTGFRECTMDYQRCGTVAGVPVACCDIRIDILNPPIGSQIYP